MKAWMLFATRGVRAAHTVCTLGARPAAALGADVPALRHSRSRRVRGERSHYGTQTPNRLTSFTIGALTTSGSDHVAAAIF